MTLDNFHKTLLKIFPFLPIISNHENNMISYKLYNITIIVIKNGTVDYTYSFNNSYRYFYDLYNIMDFKKFFNQIYKNYHESY